MNTISVEAGWLALLHDCFETKSMQQLRQFLRQQQQQGVTIFPTNNLLFNAFWQTPLKKTKVIILGQDPYHGIGQAHGLSFSVANGVKPPPSLVNIYKELYNDLGIDNGDTGNLEPWAKQGVLLLNSVLTVEANKAASHRDKGWEVFTDEVIKRVSAFHTHLVFILWGAYARKKRMLITGDDHCIIESAHPSPLSAYNGFFNSRPFSQTNHYLQQNSMQPINWQL